VIEKQKAIAKSNIQKPVSAIAKNASHVIVPERVIEVPLLSNIQTSNLLLNSNKQHGSDLAVTSLLINSNVSKDRVVVLEAPVISQIKISQMQQQSQQVVDLLPAAPIFDYSTSVPQEHRSESSIIKALCISPEISQIPQ
jgi:hypothetical protein